MTKTTVSGDASVINVKFLKTLIENHSKPSDIQECQYISASKAEQFKPLIRTIQNHIVYEQNDIHVEPTHTQHHYCPVYFSDVEKIFRHCSFTVCAYCEHFQGHAQIMNINSLKNHALKENAPPKALSTAPLSRPTLCRIGPVETQDFHLQWNIDSDKMTTIDSSVPLSEESNHVTTVSGSAIIHKEIDEHVDNSTQIVKPSTASLVLNKIAPALSIPGENCHNYTKSSQEVTEMSDISTEARSEAIPAEEIDKRVVNTCPEVVKPGSPHLLLVPEITDNTLLRTESSEKRAVTETVSLVFNKVVPAVNITKETTHSDAKTSQDVVETSQVVTPDSAHLLPKAAEATTPRGLISEERTVTATVSQVIETSQVVTPDSAHLLPKSAEATTPRGSISEERTVTATVSQELNKITPAVSLFGEIARSETSEHSSIAESDLPVTAEEIDELVTDSIPRITKPNLDNLFPKITEIAIPRRSITHSFEEGNSGCELSQEALEVSDHSTISDMESEDSESDPEFLVSPLRPLLSRVVPVVPKTSSILTGSTKYTRKSVHGRLDEVLKEHDREEHLKKMVSNSALELSTSTAGELMLLEGPLSTLAQNRMDEDPPGLEVFDMSRMCHFFDSHCIQLSEKLPIEMSSSFEKKLFSIPTDILLHVIESKGLESCAVGHLSEMTKHSLLNFLWRIMAVSEKYLTVASCQRLINYIVCELKNRWSPSLIDVAAILINLGATENSCPLKVLLKSASEQLDEEFPVRICTEQTNHEQIFQNLRRVLQTLAILIKQSNYSSLESAQFVLLMCWLSLDHKLNNCGFKPEIQSCIREGLDKISEQDWPEKLEYLCRELVSVGKDHHNLSWMATFFPPSSRGLQLQRSFSFTAIQILVDEEPVFCYQVSPQDVLQFLRRRKINSKLDRHLLYSFFQLLNMSISLRILQQDEKIVEELADSIMETFSILRDNPCEVETTYVKTLLVGIRTKWMCLVNSGAIKRAYCPDSPSSLSSDSS